MLRQFRALIVGAPGSGKGTISSRIIRKFDLSHIASGDIIRKNVIDGTPVGVKAKHFVDTGELVPDEIVISVILQEIQKCGTKNWLLDGFPRTLYQANRLNEVASIDAIINLVVPFDVIINRVKNRWIHPRSGRVYNTCFNPPKVPEIDDITGEPLMQRPDDKPESVKKRLEVYSNTINPILDLYHKKGVLENFNGSTSDEIWPMVYKYLALKLNPLISDKVS